MHAATMITPRLRASGSSWIDPPFAVFLARRGVMARYGQDWAVAPVRLRPCVAGKP